MGLEGRQPVPGIGEQHEYLAALFLPDFSMKHGQTAPLTMGSRCLPGQDASQMEMENTPCTSVSRGAAWSKGWGRVHILVGHPSGWPQSPQ